MQLKTALFAPNARPSQFAMMRIVPAAILVLLNTATIALAAEVAASLPIVRVAQGEVRGVQQTGVTAFLGVPYAAAPVAANRWRDPQPLSAWQRPLMADHYGHSCYQSQFSVPPWTHEYVDQESISEDCLYLNIWTPTVSRAARMPVLFWIHGGAFVGGASSVPIYNGATLARRGIVVVSINYRVGAFGFLAHPELSRESAAQASGNYGLLDILAALRWVHRNIRAFGGDADQVTIAGQSAGAAAVMALLQMPQAHALFKRAIAESGPVLPVRKRDLRAAEAAGQALAVTLGAADIATLRAMPAERIQAAISGPPQFGPVLDGWLLHADLAMPDRGAVVNDVPILTGLAANERGPGSPLEDFGGPPVAATLANYADKVTHDFGADAAQILRVYPATDDTQTVTVARRLARDRGIAAVVHWGYERKRHARSAVFVYMYNHVEPGPNSERDGAFHTSEVPFVFGTLDAAPERGFDASERRFSKQMQRYWVNFVRSGDPNGNGQPAWPAFTADDPRFMVLDKRFEARQLLSDEQLRAFDAVLQHGGRLDIL